MTTTQTEIPTKAPRQKTVAEDMPQRALFDTRAAAEAYLGRMSQEISDFVEVPFIGNGFSVNEAGEAVWDDEIYNDDMRIMVAVLNRRVPAIGKEGEKGYKPGYSVARAIIVTPIPTLEAVYTQAPAWLDAVLVTELNHITVRQLRTADDVMAAADTLKRSLTEFTTSGRESSGIMEGFDKTFQAVNKAIGLKVKAWANRRLTKAELRKACANAAYAAAIYPELETRPGGKPSRFVTFIELAKQLAINEGYDATIFDKWLAERDNARFDGFASDDEDEDIDMDDLTAALDTDDDNDSTPA